MIDYKNYGNYGKNKNKSDKFLDRLIDAGIDFFTLLILALTVGGFLWITYIVFYFGCGGR